MSSVDLSIVIVSWNGLELLRRCLASIAGNSDGLRLQTLVIDNASSDGTPDMVTEEFPEVVLVNSGANLGFGRACNLARTRALSEYVLFLNPDTELRPYSFRRMLEHMRAHPEIGALGCRMIYPTGETQEQGLQYIPTPWTELLAGLFLCGMTRPILAAWLPHLDPEKSAYVVKLYGGCVLCPRSVLDQVGWFDERYFMYAEDVDLCVAVAGHGKRLYYLADATIVHSCGAASGKAPSGFAVLMKAESIEKFIHKHQGPISAILYRVASLVTAAIRMAVLLAILPGALLLGISRRRRILGAMRKYRFLLAWSLGLQRAPIPVSERSRS